MEKKINFLVIGVEPLIRYGLIKLIENHWPLAQFMVLETIETERQKKLVMPDVIILDVVTQSGEESLREFKKLKNKFSHSSIMILSWLGTAFFAVPYLRAGASAFLSKNTDLSEVITAVTNLLNGKRFCSEELMKIIIDNVIDTEKLTDFSDEEVLVADLLSKRMKVNCIAVQLNIEPSRVRFFKKKLLTRLNINKTSLISERITL